LFRSVFFLICQFSFNEFIILFHLPKFRECCNIVNGIEWIRLSCRLTV
jgi:hypothetical protein